MENNLVVARVWGQGGGVQEGGECNYIRGTVELGDDGASLCLDCDDGYTDLHVTELYRTNHTHTQNICTSKLGASA